MSSGSEEIPKPNKTAGSAPRQPNESGGSLRGLHPAWHDFVRFCEKLCHGDIERLKIQDGLPVLAELTTKKVKFG